MKRLHVSLAVSDLNRSVGFYATLFGQAPAVLKPDYAKWMLEDPRVNFSIGVGRDRPGLDHLGIQVDSNAELQGVADRLKQAGQAVFDQPQAACCYARSDKAWVHDPQGVAWETFHTYGGSASYGEDRAMGAADADKTLSGCCAPAAAEAPVKPTLANLAAGCGDGAAAACC
ncbi:MAG: ArsI/CadI family heavy metal resistance metalloenzyme [Dongiaceae bacterium]